MIFTFILLLFASLWAVAIQVMPVGVLPAGVTSAIGTGISWMWVANPVIDIPTLLTILGLFFATEAIIQLAEFFFWVYSKVPVFGKK